LASRECPQGNRRLRPRQAEPDSRPRRGSEAWIAGREAADGSQPDRGDDEDDQASGRDARALAWRAAKMIESGLIRPGPYRTWKRLSDSYMSVALAPCVFAERASLNYGRRIGTLPMRPIKNESVWMHPDNLDKVTGDFQTGLLMAGSLSPGGTRAFSMR
jgi:hypothetical protein